MIITVGPVSSHAARLWTSHLLANLVAVRGASDKLPFRLPLEVADAFEALLQEWHEVARTLPTFVWSEDLDPDWVRLLVRYWANLDSLTDEHLSQVGISWSPPDARPFFVALADGVAQAFRGIGQDDPFSELLARRADGG
ncbi:MAG TPA: hypothetical protein VM345_13130 [Acidimicrobiales bacterium]|jgi:hypothetical protein|nr:hypothetical protein [Acidimicrobiales bacterium]